MPVDAVKRFGEVAGQGICGGDGAGAGAEGCYGSSMGDDWRVRIAFGDLPGQLTDDQVYARLYPSAQEAAELEPFRQALQALIPELGSCLGDQVTVSSGGTEIFLYAPAPDRLMRPHEWRVRCSRGATSARSSGRSAGARGKSSGWM
jgi:hypothetical protein